MSLKSKYQFFPYWLKLVCAVILIGGLSYLGWYLITKKDAINTVKSIFTINKNTKTNTANWNTYTSDTYGFSFEYPKEWEITRDTIDDASVDSIGGRKVLDFYAGKEDSATLKINFEGGFEGVSYYKKGEIKNNKISIIQTEDWSQNFALYSVKQIALYVEKFSAGDSMVFVYNYKGDSGKATALFDQIISTFKFSR
jgi:hypothetical protein